MLMALGFVPNSSATAAEFERAIHDNASAFWIWAISAGLVWLGAPLWWWMLPPGLVAAHSAVAWISCRRAVKRLQLDAPLPIKKHVANRKRAANSNDRLIGCFPPIQDIRNVGDGGSQTAAENVGFRGRFRG